MPPRFLLSRPALIAMLALVAACSTQRREAARDAGPGVDAAIDARIAL